MLLLFQVAAGAGLRNFMWDASVEEPMCYRCTNCILNKRGQWEDYNDCGGRIGAVIFFDIYYLGVTYVLLNLFVAVLLDNFFTFTGGGSRRAA